MQNLSARKIAFAGAVGALYAALTMGFSFIGFGPLQFRIAEALCVLPFFFPVSALGLFTGCIIANLMSPYPLDIIIGPAATLLAALCTVRIGRFGRDRISLRALACLPPVVINAVLIGALIAYYMTGDIGAGAFAAAFIVSGAQVGFGQLVVMSVLGLPLMIYFPKTRVYKKLAERL